MQSASYLHYNNKQSLSNNCSASQSARKLYLIYIDVKVANAFDAERCVDGSLDPSKEKEKIIVGLYDIFSNGTEMKIAVQSASGIGIVIAYDELIGDILPKYFHVLPATHISYSDDDQLFSYLSSSKAANGCLTRPKTECGVIGASIMADFPSVSPKQINYEIFKPNT